MAAERLALSVVVTSYNQRSELERLLPRLCDQTLSGNRYEILVVDDGSTDGSREWLATRPSPVRPLIGSTDRGRSRSRNAGIAAAQGEIVVMLDGDHMVSRDFLECHLAAHAAEHCAIVGKSVFVDHPDFRALNAYLNDSGAAKLPRGTRLPGRYFLTRNCSVRRQTLLDLGGFDEEFTAWGGEDLDLGVRLECAGVPIYGLPAALAIHHHLRPLPDLLRNLYRYGRDGIPLLLRKHPFLFSELNLDHILVSPQGQSRFSGLHRLWFRALISAPIYISLRALAHLLRRHTLPRALFDYLHLRQYARGYMDSLRASGLR
ncbi:glycosyltransferase [candidate division KSB1 bacterium]|nr:glycosyltransferase [candidate division KSB1 bacterium]